MWWGSNKSGALKSLVVIRANIFVVGSETGKIFVLKAHCKQYYNKYTCELEDSNRMTGQIMFSFQPFEGGAIDFLLTPDHNCQLFWKQNWENILYFINVGRRY